jgi:hypothetical protein
MTTGVRFFTVECCSKCPFCGSYDPDWDTKVCKYKWEQRNPHSVSHKDIFINRPWAIHEKCPMPMSEQICIRCGDLARSDSNACDICEVILLRSNVASLRAQLREMAQDKLDIAIGLRRWARASLEVHSVRVSTAQQQIEIAIKFEGEARAILKEMG